MVQVKLDGKIISMRGRIGGVYGKNDGGIQHIQAMPRHVNYQRVGAQGRYRDAFSAAGAFWILALVAFFSAVWAAYAIAHLFRKPGHEPKRITGYNWYIHYALTFPERDEFHPFWQPPHSPGDLPNYVTTYKGKRTYQNVPGARPPESCTGYFWDSKIPWNGKAAYRTDDAGWHIWWKDPTWAISPGPGFEPPALTFYSPAGEPIGWYQNPVTGSFAHVYNGKRQV